MNVALFASAFYPHVGGVEELTRQLAHAYRARDIGVVVLTNRWPRSLPAYEEYEDIPTYRLALRVPEGSLKARLNYRMTHQGIKEGMLGILRQHKTDLLHVQCVSANGYYALLAKESLGLPLVVTAQGERTMDAGGIYQRSAFLNQTLCSLLTKAKFITACSQDTLADLIGYSGQTFGERARVIYNGIRLADFDGVLPYQHPRPYVLGIGRHVPQKGFDVLLRAFAAVVKSRETTHDLLLAGDGPERASLQRLTVSLGISDRVQFLGRVGRADAARLFAGCSFFALPSRMEPQGIVNLEAMACGKAVIASRTGGVPEIVRDGSTGLLVPPEDAGALASAMHQLIRDAPLRDKLGTAGRARAQEFDWSMIAAQYLDVYREIGGGAPTA